MSDRLGPLRLPAADGGKLLVLDGQQRLTTLAGVLLLEELERSHDDDRDPGRWIVYYDAASDNFAYFDDGSSPLSAVRVSELMGTKGLYRAAQRIMGATDDALSTDTRSQWLERIEAVSAAFSAYRVPLVIFATDSMQLAVESFTRLNRAGKPVGPDELVSALTYEVKDNKETFRLASHIDVILADLAKEGFGDVDRIVVLRIVLLNVGLDPFRTEWDKLAGETQKSAFKALPKAIDETKRGIFRAVQFLRDEGIWNTRLLPYSIHLMGLAAFFGQKDSPTPEQEALLRRWLWVSAFTEGFGGLNPSRILVQLKTLREVVPTQPAPMMVAGMDLDAPAHPFPDYHDLRSARGRALLCVMLRRPTLKQDGDPIRPDEAAAMVLKRGPEALVRVCARVLKEARLASSPANRVLDVVSGHRTPAKSWIWGLDPVKHGDVLASHHISEDAWHALKTNEHSTFVKERRKTLMALERSFMLEKGVTPPKDDQTAPSAIDVEEEAPLGDEVDSEAD